MLKLEKNSKSQDISIVVRKRERFLSQSFLIAFAIAFALHFFAGVFFQIRTFKVFDHGSLIPPVAVNASLTQEGEQELEYLVKAQIDDEKKLSRYLLAPKKSTPRIPEISIFPSKHQLEYSMDDKYLMNYFTDLEKGSDEQYLKLVVDEPFNPPIQINVSGKIAENSEMILTSELQDFLQSRFFQNSSLAKNKRNAFVYSILVEEKSGKIFWYEPKNFARKMDRSLTEKILKGIIFTPNTNGFVASGEIEILAAQDD